MSRQSLQILGVTGAVGLALAIAAAGVASAQPSGVGGLSQRVVQVHTTLPINQHTTVEASCAADEFVTGGGFTVYSIGPGDKVFSNSPKGESTWHVEIINETADGLEVDVFAVCVSRAGGH